MSNIDDKIREALPAEDAKLLAEVGGEQSLHEMVIDSLRGKSKWLIVMIFSAMFVITVLAVLAAVQFFQVESVREMIAYATAFVFCLLGGMAMKIWYWMELNKNAITREVKRLELQVARLSRAVSVASTNK